MAKLIATLATLGAFTIAQAEDSTVSPSPSPTATPTPSLTPEKELLTLTPGRLQKLIKANQDKGDDFSINDVFTIALRLPKGTLTSGRQVGTKFGTTTIIFFQSRNLDGYIFGVQTDVGVFIFYVDKSLNFISAAKKLTGKEVVAVSDNDEAKHDLALVLDRWAQVLDKQDTKNAKQPQKQSPGK
jgi:hypothetical protein